MAHHKPSIARASTAQADENNDEDSDSEEDVPTLKTQFVAFAKAKGQEGSGSHINLSQSDYWMKQANVLQGRKLTTTDTGVCYLKFKKYKLSFEEYAEFLQILADYKKMPVNEIIEKMVNCGPPQQDTNVNLTLGR